MERKTPKASKYTKEANYVSENWKTFGLLPTCNKKEQSKRKELKVIYSIQTQSNTVFEKIYGKVIGVWNHILVI